MKSILLTFLILGGLRFVPLLASAPPAPLDLITVNAGDNLKFSVIRIDAKPGQIMHVRLHNSGTQPKVAMGHNWILLATTRSADAYAMAAMSAQADNYEPKALQGTVLARVPLLGPGETGDVTFTAPAQPGSYPFLCSFPAHYAAGMRGLLVVQ